METTATGSRNTSSLWMGLLLVLLMGPLATPCAAQQTPIAGKEDLSVCMLEQLQSKHRALFFAEYSAALRLPSRYERSGPPNLPPQHLKSVVEPPPLPTLDALPITAIDPNIDMVYVQPPTLLPDSLPQPDPVVASYYHSALAGNLTANGERYDPQEMTAAHRSLPFGTRLRVTNVRNGKSVVVRVNDRGPFIEGRAVDLSHAAAKLIGMLRRGIARVTLEEIDGL